ncbi:ATM interactor-like [Argopecten irradians]|uniref:ATM interactor-like n=1 Tax=Argopecten irradians TaxID=31199 RepID=UPI0037166A24
MANETASKDEQTEYSVTLDENRGVWIVCPPENAFEGVQCNVPCPIQNCGQILPTTSCLRMHVRKTHGIEQESSTFNNGNHNADFPTEFHCPLTSCPYNISSPRHFKSMKLLKQHYNKVHAEKKYKCGKCDAAFGLSRDKERHESRCGIVYKCGTCQCPYTTREAMLTHCQRKSHDIPAEIIKAREDQLIAQKTKKAKKRQVENKIPNTSPFAGQPPPKVILVNIQPTPPSLPTKPSFKVTHHKPILCKPTPNINLIPLTTVTVTQNNVEVNQKKIKEKPNADSNGNSGESSVNTCDVQTNKIDMNTSICQTQIANTQTPAIVMETGIQTHVTIPLRKMTNQQRNAAQTQTSGDLILQAAMATANIPIHKLSVGTQMTPRTKVRRALGKGSVCSSETQTVNDQTRKRRRRKGPLIAAPLRIDSTSQTLLTRPKAYVTMTSDSTCQVENISMMNTCAQTNRMVDNICQTLSTPLQDIPHDVLQYSSTRPEITMGQNSNASVNRNQFISSNPSMSTDRQSQAVSKQHRKAVSMGTSCSVATVHLPGNVVTASESPRNLWSTASNISQGTSTDLDIGDELQNILISTYRDISVGTDADEMQSSSYSNFIKTKHLPSSNFNNFVEASTQVMDNQTSSPSTEYNITESVLCGQTSRGNNVSSITSDLGQSNRGLDVGTVTSDLQQNISDFVSLTDSQVQTLSPASDLDSLLQSTQTNTAAPDTLMDMHTQTINDFDVFDLLMNNMETQTTDDLDLDNFTFTDIQTQTMFDFQQVDDPLSIGSQYSQSSAGTQTATGIPNLNEATQTPQLDSACLTDTQTQTPLPGLFALTNTHTQTTLDDLANIFAQFE